MESLKGQTIGFENIQWVITVHNSEKQYLDAVKEMAAPLPQYGGLRAL